LGPRKIVAPAFPGFGGREPGTPSLEAFAETILSDLDREGIDEAVFLGMSMGGYVAFRLFELAPERFRGLVLADTRAGADDHAGKQKRSDQAARARREGIGWLPEALIPALLGRTTLAQRPGVVQSVRKIIEAASPEGVARALEAMGERPDSTPLLQEIRVPVLVVCGAEDTLTPVEEARKMVLEVPRGKLVVLPGAGHLSNLEAPAAFNEALREFLG
jgi:3-oxoadipate enol-lactonase